MNEYTIAYYRQVYDDNGRPDGLSPWPSFYDGQGFATLQEAIEELARRAGAPNTNHRQEGEDGVTYIGRTADLKQVSSY